MPGMIRILLPLLLAATPSPPPDATTTVRGLVNTKDQAFSGHKHFDGGIYTPKINGVPVETTAVVSLFVNPTGSDTANCTDVSTPCATINGARAKLPNHLRHNATITLAAGTYTLTSSQLIDGLTMTDGVSLTIQGSTTWTQWTPASGTATGALTGFTALAFPTRAIFTDSTQTWPAASTWAAAGLGIRGRFVCMTSGIQSGNKFPISAASPTTLEVSRTSFTGGNPATGNTYEICTPSTILTGAVSGLIKIGTGTGTVNLNNLSFEPSAPNISALSMGATGGRQGGFLVALNRIRARTFPTGGGTGITLTTNGNYGVTVTDSAIIATTANEGGNDSTAITAGSNQGALGAARFTFTDVYVRGMRTALAAAHSLVVVNGLTVDSENIASNVVVSLNKVEITSFVNGWVNCYSGEGSSQSTQSGVAMTGGGRASVFSLQVKGCQIGVDLGNFGGTTQTPQSTGSVFAFSGTTARIDLVNIGQSSPTTGAGIMLGGSTPVNLKGGTVTLTTVANGARDYVCPDLTTAFTEAAVQADGDKYVECQGASVQR